MQYGKKGIDRFIEQWLEGDESALIPFILTSLMIQCDSYRKKTDEYRTPRINLTVSYIAYFQWIISNKKGKPELDLNLASFAIL